ncbi:macro domain-containing protein [Colletotrichum karsti]|uniref:Macro domain-containing protein n=1 Tax=Colletotrichum karsti TaxID=1095194 RepID=A0A9P6IEN3_9PEZI|nr:macro domain-containing protein [Colletotrichum karsti]KAF9881449.1 macro domain-containing protein [Colletotrichum karsti]
MGSHLSRLSCFHSTPPQPSPAPNPVAKPNPKSPAKSPMPVRQAVKMATTAAADIPTVELLYKLGKLSAPTKPLFPPNASHNQKVAVIRGDITKLGVDAIVNAANTGLLGGGGVDGAIHRAAGRGLLQECRTLNGCATGSAKITGAYNLPCKKVIHAVGPVYDELAPESSVEKLKGCYQTSLELAVQNGCRSIAFSAISTGVYGYPSRDAAPVAAGIVRKFLDGENGDKLDKVVFCTFEMKDVNAYNDTLPNFFPPTDKNAPQEEVSDGPSKEEAEEAKAIAAELPSVPKADPSA